MTIAAPDTSALMAVTLRPDTVFTRGRGSWLFDSAGRSWLDLLQGWAVNTLGHAPPEIAEALAEQSRRLLQPGPGLHNDRAAALAARLAALSGLERAYFTSSGAEANEGAIKLARKFGQVHRGGAHEIITFEGAFHGRTLATMSASGKPGFERLFEPKVPGFLKARLNDLASVQALIGPRTVAGKRSGNDTLVQPLGLRWAALAYVAAGVAVCRSWAAGVGGRQLCGSSWARSRCFSVGKRSNTSFR